METWILIFLSTLSFVLLWLQKKRRGAGMLPGPRKQDGEAEASREGRDSEEAFRLLVENQRRMLEASKDRFLEDISHEMRTPLTGLIASLEILEVEAGDEPGILEWVRMSKDSALRLNRIIEKAEEMVRLSTGLEEAGEEDLSLDSVLAEVWDRIRDEARERRIHCRFLWPSPALRVRGSRRSLVRLLELVLENALLFSGEEGEVSLVCSTILDPGGEDRVLIEILDEGEGIPQSEISEVFRPFHQVTSPDKGKPPGLGLGLAIAKALSRNLRTEIGVRSRSSGGTCFHFLLPCAFTHPGNRPGASFAPMKKLSNRREISGVHARSGSYPSMARVATPAT